MLVSAEPNLHSPLLGCYKIPLHFGSAAWLGIPISDSDSWDGRNPEFPFRVRNSGSFLRKIKSQNLKTVQVNRNSGIPLITYIATLYYPLPA
jgi:hypothetical protein